MVLVLVLVWEGDGWNGCVSECTDAPESPLVQSNPLRSGIIRPAKLKLDLSRSRGKDSWLFRRV